MSSLRNSVIIKTSVIGIGANVLLASFKAVVGLAVHSVAVLMDAVNNLSDALSSLITIIGAKLSQKAPDKKHPLGHGRYEYLSATVISVIVLYAGVAALTESVKAIIHPKTPEYSTVSLIIISAAVIVKIILGTYVKKTGKRVDSDALTASGSDALFDAVISLTTLVAAVIFILTGISTEAYLGAVIALIIVKSGIEMLRETLSEILGERIDPALAKKIKSCINSFPEVGGAYDLVIHNYGPEYLIGSVHIELPDTMTVGEADALERDIAEKVNKECGVIMAGISVYSANTESAHIREKIQKVLDEYPEVLETHGFYIEDGTKNVKLDIIIDFDAENPAEIYNEVSEKIRALYPDYNFDIFLDADISD
ncbi:MAG: cation transporter [Abditibacteriota bacterium]|nr:cation transporter [Abditibacteriota bacterium]